MKNDNEKINTNSNLRNSSPPKQRFKNLQNIQEQQLMKSKLRKQLKSSEQLLKQHFRNVTEAQEKMYYQMDQNISEDAKNQLKQESAYRTDQLQKQLKQLSEFYRKNRKYLNSYDKLAFKIYYKNRRNDLSKLERHARYTFSDIEDEGTEAFDKITDSSDKLLDVINSINLNKLADGLEEDSQSFTDIKRDLQTTLHYNSNEWKKYSKEVSDIVSDLNNKVSRSQVAQVTQELAGYGIKNNIDKYTKSMTEFTTATGSSVSELENMIRTTNKLKNGSKIITMYGDFVNELKSNKKTKYLMDETSQEDWNQDMNTMSKSIFAMVGTDQAKYEKAMKGYMTRNAAGEANDISGGVNEILNNIATAKTDQLGELSAQYGGMNAQAIQNMMKQGDFGQAYDTVVKQMMTMAKNGMLTNNSEYAEAFGLDTDEIKKLSEGSFTYEDYQKQVKDAKSAYNSSKGSMEDYIKNDLPVSIGTQVSNAFGNSVIGQKLSEFLDNTGLDTTDILTGLGAINSLTGGKITGLLSKIPFIGKFFGGGGAASGGGFLTSLLSKIPFIGKFFSNGAGVAEAGAETAETAGASGILTGTGTKLLSGIVDKLPIIGGIAGLISGGVDAYGNVKDTKGGLLDKITAGIGGFLGGNHAGVFDKNTGVLGKIGNVAGGVGKGAGIGAAIGSIVPGIGTAIGAGVGAGVGGVGSLLGGKNIGNFLSTVIGGIGSGIGTLGTTIISGASDLGKVQNNKNSKDAKRSRLSNVANISTNDYIIKIYDLLRARFSAVSTDSGGISSADLTKAISSLNNSNGSGNSGGSDTAATSAGSTTTTQGSLDASSSGSPYSSYGSKSTTAFFDKIKGGAIETYNKYGILPSITMAQAAIESGWGKSGLTAKANNLFGMKAGSSWKGSTVNMNTGEQASNGSRYRTNANFRAYGSWADSIEDHGKLLSTSRYKDVKGAKNYSDAAYALKKAGYATDQSYPSTIISMIKKYHLNELDPKYKVGTPWIPNDQVAVVHEGEMIVPKENNPFNNSTSTSTIPIPDNNTSVNNSTDLDTVVDVIKWAVSRIEKKDDEIIQAINNSSNSNSTESQSYDTSRDSDMVFSF